MKYFKIMAFGMDKTMCIKKITTEQYEQTPKNENIGSANARTFNNGDEALIHLLYLLNLGYKLEVV